MSKSGTFIFAGGGTGGHLYPGLAIAEQLRRLNPDAKVLFLCSDREIDRKVLEPEDVPFKSLPAKPIAMGVRKMWRFVSSWPGSVRATRAAIREARSHGPVHMVAMGGFVAAPAVQAARAERVPVTLVNLDAAPGKANRWIANRVGSEVAFTTVADAAHPSWKLVAPIVRSEATATRDKAACRRELGLDPAKPVLMITGGSQGATSINLLMAALAKEHGAAFTARGWQVLHQTGKDEEAGPTEVYKNAGVRAVVVPFTRQMGLWWGAADLAVSRSGAGAVAEAWCNRVPCVFLPYPYHADDHQRLNAQELEKLGVAVVCKDRVTAATNLGESGKVIAGLLTDPSRLGPMAAAAAGLPAADGAAVIAAHLASRMG
ncbi:MAG: UDP-N-acetylglucosamine--N-acetylmuramyl-(pentapeptide) pyrophosphoryl-undecaprenol N-acetylglucosamine transferase [Phycisphaerales bacterium]